MRNGGRQNGNTPDFARFLARAESVTEQKWPSSDLELMTFACAEFQNIKNRTCSSDSLRKREKRI